MDPSIVLSVCPGRAAEPRCVLGVGRGASDAWPPPAGMLSLAPTHVLEGLQVGDKSPQPTPAPLPMEGLGGCCTGSPPIAVAAAAAVV